MSGGWKYIPIIIMVAFVASFINGSKNTDGYKNRQPPSVRDALENYQTAEYRRLKGDSSGFDFSGKIREECIHRTPETACHFGKGSTVVTVGDSFAGVFDFELMKKYKKDGFKSFTYEQCPLFDEPIWIGNVPECWEINKSRWEIFKKMSPSNFIIGTNFQQFYISKKSTDNYVYGNTNYTDSLSTDYVYNSFLSSIEKLKKIGHNVIVLNNPPSPVIEVEKELQRRVKNGVWNFKKEYGATDSTSVNNEVKKISQKTNGINFVNLENALCNNNSECIHFDENGGIFNQGGHLSNNGVKKIIPLIDKHVKTKIN